jgi:ankyrin repeat protein
VCVTEFGSLILRSSESREPHLTNLINRVFFRNAWLDDYPEPIRAAALGKVRRVRRLLDAGESPAQLSPDGDWSALHAAATRRHPRVVALLLAAGVPVDLECSNGITPLLNAAGEGDAESVRLLLAAGANPLQSNSRLGSQPLDRAVDFDNVRVVRLLITAGADPNFVDDHGFTLVMTGAESGALRSVRLLLELGADPSSVVPPGHDLAGMSAADLARRMANGSRARYRARFVRVAKLIESWPGAS